jgi:hypothetical protein
LEFATNLFGNIKPDIKKKLQKVMDKPNQKNWEEAYSIILNASGKPATLWQAVLEVDPTFQNRRMENAKWERIPTQETIIKAIQLAVFKGGVKERAINKDTLSFYNIKIN